MSRIERDRMIMLALAVVADAHWRAQKGPVARTNALRLALTYLHSQSNRDRGSYDTFWLECANRHDGAFSEAEGNGMRGAWLNPAWHGILRSLGIAPSIEFGERLAQVQARERAAFDALQGRVPDPAHRSRGG